MNTLHEYNGVIPADNYSTGNMKLSNINEDDDEYFSDEIDTFNHAETFNLKKRIISSGNSMASCNIGDVTITGKPNNLHVGTKIIIKGSVNIADPYHDQDRLLDIYDTNENSNQCIENKHENTVLEDVCTRVGGLNFNLERTKTLAFKVFHNVYLLLFMGFVLMEILILVGYIVLHPKMIESDEIPGLKLKKIGKNLTEFIPRRNEWGYDNKCSTDCPIRYKTTIRLAIPRSLGFACTILKKEYDCKTEFEKDFQNYRENGNANTLNDIYYNYIIGMQGFIYEGRSLICSYNEKFWYTTNLDDDLSKTVVIGLSYCFPGNSKANDIKTNNELRAIETLIHQLSMNNITRGEALEFELLDICKDSLIERKLIERKYTVKHYKDGFNNVVSKMDKKELKNLLFESYDENTLGIIVKANLTEEIHNSSKSFSTVNKNNVTIRIFHADQLNITFPDTCTDRLDCIESFDAKREDYKNVFKKYEINYFAFLSANDTAFRIYPLNAKHGEIVISIVIHIPTGFIEPERYFPRLSQLLLPITTEVVNSLHTIDASIQSLAWFENKILQFMCNLETISDKYDVIYYEFLSKIDYIFVNKRNEIENMQYCGLSPAVILGKQN